MMTAELDKMVRRAYRHYYDDGLVELAVGLLFAAAGLVMLAWRRIGDSPALAIFLVLAIPTLTLGGAFLLTRGIRAAKSRITYPRTGYVAYREGEPAVARRLVNAALLLILITALVLLPEQYNQLQLLVGGLLGVILLYLGYRVGLWRFYPVAALALLAGLGSAAWLSDELVGTGLTFGLAGLGLLVTGRLTLLRYLGRHPRAGEQSA
jgi:hypothetical protein